MKGTASKAIRLIVAVLLLGGLLLIPTIALAENADESQLAYTLEWGEGINGNFQHNTWYSAERHWVTLVYEGDVWVSYTADYGDNWTNARVIDAGNTTFRGLSIWYDEPRDILHMARVADGNITGNQTDIIYHSSYTPTSAGLVEIEGEVPVEDGLYVDGDVGTITIACDENGYPFIAWTEAEFTIPPTIADHYWVEVSDSDTNDGTWVELSSDAFYEFDGTGAAMLGHDYDTLWGDGNWTVIAVNLTPIDTSGDLMQLAWSIEESENTDTAGIDSTIWDGDLETWGNLSWVVPMESANGLYPSTMGEIAFDFYDIGSTIYCVYNDDPGDLYFQGKSPLQDWDNINGIGNWTQILEWSGYALPSLSGYDAPGLGEDLIVIYHDMDSLYYRTRAYAGTWDASWTTIWDVDDHSANPAHGIFLHNTQYKYGAGSPVGFAWDWATLEWEPGMQTGYLDYWWIDQDGEDEGADPLGWYLGAIGNDIANNIVRILVSIAVAIGLVIGALTLKLDGVGFIIYFVGGAMLLVIINTLL